MFSNLIHNTGRNWAPRKPVARMFEPIATGGSVFEGHRFSESGNRDCPRPQVPCVGTFAERNAKPERKQCKNSQVSDASIAQPKQLVDAIRPSASHAENTTCDNARSRPEFKVGDLVECLPDSYMAIGPHEGVHKICAIEGPNDIDPITAACFDDIPVKGIWWPLRALRHAETEPRAEDGWYMRKPVLNENRRIWVQSVNVAIVCERTNGTWGTNKLGPFNSWLALKRAMGLCGSPQTASTASREIAPPA